MTVNRYVDVIKDKTITSITTTSDERDCPLNLSISLSGEKENNNDSQSNGE